MMEDNTNQRLHGCPQPPIITTTRTVPESLDANTISGSSNNAATTLNLQGELVHQTITTTKENREQRFANRHLLKAMDLNYEGVCLLQSGEDEEKAITVFKRSLVCVKSALDSQKSLSTSLDIAPSLASSSPEHSNHCIIDDQHHHPMTVVPVEIHKPNSLDDLLYVYTKAFVFQTSHAAANQGEAPAHHANLLGPGCSIVDSELLSATIVYNIGLALHFKAIRANSSFLRQKSLSLYEMSIGLLHRILEGKDKDSYSDDASDHLRSFQVNLTHQSMSILTTFLIVCSNNAWHLSYCLQDDYERSCRTMNNLQFLLKLFVTKFDESHKRRLQSPSSLSPRRPSSSFFRMLLGHDDIRGFSWNIMFMYPPTCAPAA